MKRTLLILLISLMAVLAATAQDSTSFKGGNGTVVNIAPLNTPKLIADETCMTYTKTGAKVVTFSESVFKELSLRFGDQFTSIMIRRKKDRHGEYKEYTMLMSSKTGVDVTNWSKQNL